MARERFGPNNASPSTRETRLKSRRAKFVVEVHTLAVRTIRISMPDRPGALSAICVSVAAHLVDIVSLDVVSHEGEMVVDDLTLSADSEEAIGAAIAGFRPEVSARAFNTTSSDVALAMGNGLMSVANQNSNDAGRIATLESAVKIGRADNAAWLRLSPDGHFDAISATTPLPPINADEPFDGRWAQENLLPAAFPARIGWVGHQFDQAFYAAWVCTTPIDAFEMVLIGRTLSIPFYQGELARLAVFIRAAASVVGARAEKRTAFDVLPPMTGTPQPPRAVTLARTN